MLEAFQNNIKDPNWWFTVVIAGLVIGCFANLITDFLYRFAGKLFTPIRDRYKARKKRFNSYVDLLKKDKTLLTVECTYCICQGLLFLFMATMMVAIFLGTKLWIRLDMPLVDEEIGIFVRRFYNISLLILGILAFYKELKFISSYHKIRAVKRYRLHNKKLII